MYLCTVNTTYSKVQSKKAGRCVEQEFYGIVESERRTGLTHIVRLRPVLGRQLDIFRNHEFKPTRELLLVKKLGRSRAISCRMYIDRNNMIQHPYLKFGLLVGTSFRYASR